MHSLISILALGLFFMSDPIQSQPSNVLLLRVDNAFLSGTRGVSIDKDVVDLTSSIAFPMSKGKVTQLRVFVNRKTDSEALAQPFIDTARLRFFLPNNPACANITETTGLLTIYPDGLCNGGADSLVLAVFILTPNLQDIELQNSFLFRVQSSRTPIGTPPRR